MSALVCPFSLCGDGKCECWQCARCERVDDRANMERVNDDLLCEECYAQWLEVRGFRWTRSRLDMKIDPKKRAQYEAAAKEDGVPLSVWIRLVLDAEIKRRKRRQP